MPLLVTGRSRLALAAVPFIGRPTHLPDEPYYRQDQRDDAGQKSDDLCRMAATGHETV